MWVPRSREVEVGGTRDNDVGSSYAGAPAANTPTPPLGTPVA
jgi:hypothetical protein